MPGGLPGGGGEAWVVLELTGTLEELQNSKQSEEDVVDSLICHRD